MHNIAQHWYSERNRNKKEHLHTHTQKEREREACTFEYRQQYMEIMDVQYIELNMRGTYFLWKSWYTFYRSSADADFARISASIRIFDRLI